ncbi:MAG: ABC transporter permease, partial [Candidatus Promineifilaceae bacterium]
QSAAPVLWSGGLLATAEESIGVEIMGIDPDDAFHEPIRNGIVAGEYLKGDDRGRILVSSLLAKQMKINLNDRVSIAMSNANGEGQEGVFTVVGLYDTGFPGIDQNRVILPLQQAQAFAGVDGYASSLILMLTDRDEAPALARQLESETLMVETWEDLNSIMLDSIDIGRAYYNIVYAIIFIMVAVLIVNTLLMSVFERLREIGVLASIGMRGRQIMLLFLLEAFMLTVLGIVLGWILGLGAVSYLTFVGIPIPAEAAALVEGIAFGTRMYGGFAPLQFVVLSLLLLVVVLLVSLYPAWFAARLEPVEALHAF